jgi:hypothetical protein
MKSNEVILQDRLRKMQGRALSLNGLTADPAVMNSLKPFFDRAMGPVTAERRKEMLRLVQDAWDSTEKKAELCGLRVTTVDNYVRATSAFASLFFRRVDLADDERPVFQHTYRNEIRVHYMSEDGQARSIKAVKAQKQIFIDLRVLTSDEVSYQIRDVYQGDITDMSLATVDIGYDMTNKVDAEAYNLMHTGSVLYGNFTTTGAKLDRTWVPNSRIHTPNLPTTNDIVLSGNTTSTKFRLQVVRAILKYCESWGNIFGAPLRPTGVILVPSSDSTDLAEEILPTGSTNNSVADGVLSDYTQFDYMKTRWTLVPDVTLAPGVCYPVLNRAIGEAYFKPSMDEEFVETFRKKNLETRSQNKVVGFAIPEPWRPFATRVRYTTAQ